MAQKLVVDFVRDYLNQYQWTTGLPAITLYDKQRINALTVLLKSEPQNGLVQAELDQLAFLLRSPIERLPDDVLERIMITSSAGYDIYQTTSFPYVAMSVSRRWRMLAYSFPRMWSNFTMQYTVTGKADSAILNRAVSMCRDIPLTVSLKVLRELRPVQSALPPLDPGFFDPLWKTSSLWRSFTLHANDSSIINYFPPMRFPKLEYLEIKGCRLGHQYPDSTTLARGAFSSAANLKEVLLLGIPIIDPGSLPTAFGWATVESYTTFHHQQGVLKACVNLKSYTLQVPHDGLRDNDGAKNGIVSVPVASNVFEDSVARIDYPSITALTTDNIVVFARSKFPNLQQLACRMTPPSGDYPRFFESVRRTQLGNLNRLFLTIGDTPRFLTAGNNAIPFSCVELLNEVDQLQPKLAFLSLRLRGQKAFSQLRSVLTALIDAPSRCAHLQELRLWVATDSLEVPKDAQWQHLLPELLRKRPQTFRRLDIEFTPKNRTRAFGIGALALLVFNSTIQVVKKEMKERGMVVTIRVKSNANNLRQNLL
ncbi:hypothetical protein CYLTODRAFT_426304 [Cylindrobasidium torrendii FP15055 ss-10]|uniref:F-box domain-containing protein n=1 Tax=Cylindrobasidium torrendii FP15055 ss-10 TaxID=1314674 RepID=A0A0D7AZ97_9AGAR|nr:hypothetical protein CYLTODRAFT_426304 [Cylindrobasidium torrendii FP15055 ss-10]